MKARLYVDGFNFFYAIKKGDTPIWMGWCDFRKLAEQHMLQDGDALDSIKYFTAPVGRTGKGRESLDQIRWLQAVRTIPGLVEIDGFYKPGEGGMPRKEKQTDVNIAIHMVRDALLEDDLDLLILLSADTDIEPAVAMILKETGKRVAVWFPPGNSDRARKHLRGARFSSGILKDRMLIDSRLPETFDVPGVEPCPPYWRKPA